MALVGNGGAGTALDDDLIGAGGGFLANVGVGCLITSGLELSFTCVLFGVSPRFQASEKLVLTLATF